MTVEVKPPGVTPESFTDKDDFPYLTPPPGARLKGTSHWKQPLTFAIGEKGTPRPVGSGFIEKYDINDPTIAELELQQAYSAALEKGGWKVMPPHTRSVSAVYEKNGRTIYAYLTRASFQVADIGEELAAALAKGCAATVYGITFDFDKATLRPDSEPTLTQILKVLKDEPKLSVEIGGHTDNVGKPDYNLVLSDHRAATLRDWLIKHGIAASRLTSHGYGDAQPLVPNTTEENRALNRRVELKKANYK